jgi:hypothetical protein
MKIIKKKVKDITVERLHEVLIRDDATGHLYIKSTAPNNRKAAGDRVGWINVEGYSTVKVDGVHLLAHRVVWAMHYGEWPVGSLDHVNGIKSDNRIENLRIATHSQNRANTLASRTSSHGTKGITLLPTGKWQAQIQHNGKFRYLGCFADKQEAAQVYADAARAAFGAFSGLERPTC